MPFSGGGGGQLTAHVHDNTPLQGGPLNFNNTTIGGMAAGDITFSDGAALQTLTYPAVPAGETLTAAALSSAPSWVAGGGAPVVTTQSITPTSAQTTTSGTFVTVANSTINLPTRAGGFAFISAFVSVLASGANTNIAIGIYHNGSLQEVQVNRLSDAGNEYPISVTATQPLDGSSIFLQWKVSSGTATMVDVANFYSSRLQTFEVS